METDGVELGVPLSLPRRSLTSAFLFLISKGRHLLFILAQLAMSKQTKNKTNEDVLISSGD